MIFYGGDGDAEYELANTHIHIHSKVGRGIVMKDTQFTVAGGYKLKFYLAVISVSSCAVKRQVKNLHETVNDMDT